MALTNIISLEQEQLFLSEGLLYFPRLVKNGNGRWSISKRNKGTHTIDVLMRNLKNLKIQAIASSYGVLDYYSSKSSNSIYFSHSGLDYRVSDHHSNSFPGIQFIVKWDTNIDQFKLKS